MSLWRVDDLIRTKGPSQDNGRRLNHGIRTAAEDYYCPNQKDLLISLNDRLAAYLEKVKRLEEANQKLEEKIKTLPQKRSSVHDHNGYLKTIDDLESQIQCTRQANAKLWLNIENTKIAADGFKEKYEAELSLQDTIRDDVKKLKAASSGLEMETRCLEVDEQILTKELENLKQNHNEEKERLIQEKSKCQVNVEIEDTMQPTELTDALEKMREQYKSIANHHQKHFESLLQKKFNETTQQNNKDTELLEKQWRHLSMLRRKEQELESELEVQHSMKAAWESELYEIEVGYVTHLENVQRTISKLEAVLVKVRSEAEELTSDSRILHYLKDLLEMEIRTYSILLNDEEKRIETVMPAPSNGIRYNRQMFLFLISESKSSLTRSLLFADQGRRHTEHVPSAYHESEENVN